MKTQTFGTVTVTTIPGSESAEVTVRPSPYSENEFPITVRVTKAEAAEIGRHLLDWAGGTLDLPFSDRDD